MLQLTENTVLALSGADMSPRRNDEPVPMNVPLLFHAGDTLELGMAQAGCRMNGPAIESCNGTDIISDGIAPGSIQVPADGKPIVLLADRQTTGGYAKIATVCSADIPRLAQCKPGDKVRFRKISPEEAQKRIREERKHELQ